MAVVRLSDYRPAPFLIERTDLTVSIHHDHAVISAELALIPNPALLQTHPKNPSEVPLELKGRELSLEHLAIDGQTLPGGAFTLSEEGLRLHAAPWHPFLLQSRVRIEPQRNTSLEGLYLSEGMITSQCEAEGFRRITFHPDRPDLLSRFRVRIEAEREAYPVLLSNGNCIDAGSVPVEADAAPRHYAIWDDPFPKPSYLFALVAGRLAEVQDRFTTTSGRDIRLRIHVVKNDLSFVGHAMAALKRSMAWDERVYGLEYDLDEFNIVAVRHFNMGAMENKSLNIFNSKLVLADAEIASDSELERIESVIAHEYFHNWTGNRITCRDWFQLSLKEGLTVFRDQQFSADQHGDALNRIDHVTLLRNTQFREDAGPTAHPVQPDHYRAIDNFYTTTIYEKGAEVIRMLRTLLGEQAFMKGFALYVARHDGSAATCEDFLQAMEDSPGPGGRVDGPPFDFRQFRRWYQQAGTPILHLHRRWDKASGKLHLTVLQKTPPTPGQPSKDPLVIPLALGAVGQAGQALPLRMEGESPEQAADATMASGWGEATRLLVIDRDRHDFTFEGLPSQSPPPSLSLLRRFSAPVRIELGRPTRELVHLLCSDSEPVARWDAGQLLMRRVVLARAAGRPVRAVEEELTDSFGKILADPGLSEASRSALMSLPRMAELEDAAPLPDPPALFQALQTMLRRFGKDLQDPLQRALQRCSPQWSLPWPEGTGDRRLTAVIWAWLVSAGDSDVIAAARDAVEGPSMTLARAGLQALQNHPIPARQQAMEAFYRRWEDQPVVLDTWFALEASAPFPGQLVRIEQLLEHPRFDPTAPNSVRAVLGGLAANPMVFHAADGSGYHFMAAQIARLDERNPITASRMAKVFSRWRSYAPERADRMRDALARLVRGPLSTNTREVVEQSLADPLKDGDIPAAAT